MPYVPEDRRLALKRGDPPEGVGDLAYMIAETCNEWLQLEPARYERIALVLGALTTVMLDFWDQVGEEYERRKRLQNGGIWKEAK